MPRKRALAHCLLLGLLAASVAGPGPALAHGLRRPAANLVLTVNSTMDEPDSDPGDGVCRTPTSLSRCTLRAAIMEGNHAGPSDSVTINVPAGLYTLTIPRTVFDETDGSLDVLHGMDILGAGADRTIVDAGGLDRVFLINTAGIVSLSDLALRNGQGLDVFGGGGIAFIGDWLFLTRVAVMDNHAFGSGGGIFISAGRLVMIESLVSGNRTSGGGGGLASTDEATIQNSTFSNNSAVTFGGGILQEMGVLDMFATTVAGNLADSDSDAYGSGGGVHNSSGDVELIGVLLAENLAGAGPNNCAGSAIDVVETVVGTTAGCTFTAIGSDNQFNVDPLLLSLHDNTGPTRTRAPLSGSPAIDAVPGFCGAALSVVDQRGVARPNGPACDAGAIEGAADDGLFGRNLIRNGDAETAAGSPSVDLVAVPHWNSLSGWDPTVVTYDAPGGWMLSTDPGPDDRGYAYFLGGAGADSILQQSIDVSAIAAEINGSIVTYDFEAYLGGFGSQADYATATARFYDGNDVLLGAAGLGPVSAADRGHQTGLLRRAASGTVPAGTVRIDVELFMVRDHGVHNDGYADNLSLVLHQLEVFLPLVLR